MSASPETIWLARNVIVTKAWIDAISAPASAATMIPAASAIAVVGWKRCTDQKPITAPTSIIPSTPRFSTPERSASSSPSEAKRSGVP